MKFLLDSNVCITFVNSRNAMLQSRLMGCSPKSLFVCSIVRAELLFGAEKSRRPAHTYALITGFLDKFTSLPFDDAAAEEYAAVRAHLSAQGRPIGGNDLMIASIALANDLILVTANTREFSRVPRLRMENWMS